VIVIDPKERRVTERQIELTLRKFQQTVGGEIELARFSDCAAYVHGKGVFSKGMLYLRGPQTRPDRAIDWHRRLIGRETSLRG
jgi:hypothetical protein